MRRLVRRSIIASAALTLLGGGTVFFHFVEGWEWIDAWLFTVVTVSTVGYGNLVPATFIGKLVASLMIIMGIGVFALVANEIAERLVDRQKTEARKAMRPPESAARGKVHATHVSKDSTSDGND